VDMHDLPSAGQIAPDTFDVASVAANTQMTSSPVALLPSDQTTIRAVAGGALTTASHGCVQVSGSTSTVELVFTHPASVQIRAPAGSVVTAHLRVAPASRIESPPHQLVEDATGSAYLEVSLAGAATVLDLPHGGAVLCGVTQ
jgi:hypothetical protein